MASLTTASARSVVSEPHHRRRFGFGKIVTVLLLAAASVVMLAPIVYTISTSLRSPMESFTLPPKWIPTDPNWENYRTVFDTVPLKQFFLNSTVVTFCIVIGQLITAALAGYAFARLEFPGRSILFWLVLSTLMIPLQATIIPVFVLISKWHLSDTLASLILPALASAFGTFLMRQYFLQIPSDFEEAALLDGASQWEIFRSIYLPLAKGGLAVLAILTFNGYWNEFLRPLIFLSSQEKFTLPVGLVSLQGYMGTGSISVVLAGVLVSLIPVLIIYLIGQRYLVEGLMVGGLKG
ncbi:MAG TPA: carbohydrate ABC transporter permease [Thermomicrobiales bacterium]|jgi:multiple sugar transport system permease protein|nr:carbohydrate ABC transporter permease [Thermomicrobiales bacterium]